MKLIYINVGKSSVFESQVLALLDYYIEHETFDSVTLLFGYQNEDDKKWMMDKKNLKLELHFFKVYPNYVFYNRLTQKSLFEVANKLEGPMNDYFFHIRSELTSYHFKKKAKMLSIDHTRILTDVRGASLPEVKEYYATNNFIKPFKLINYRLALKNLTKDRKISVVSNSLKNYVLSFSKVLENRVFINPCLIGSNFYYDKKDRKSIRQDLNLKDSDILLVFSSGGVAKWQNNEMIIILADLGFKVLNLSKISVDHKNIINRFVPYDHVPRYLSASDISFIWRDESTVNKVASPVKVSEYISSGLPIIHNGTVDMIDEFLSKDNESIQINAIEDLKFEDVRKLLDRSDREELSRKGISYFGLPKIANQYLNIYKAETD